MNHRKIVAATTVAAVAAAGAGIASGSAEPRAGAAQAGGGQTFELLERSGGLSAVDLPPRARSRRAAPSRGDMVVFTKRVFASSSGGRLGTLHAHCTVTVPGRSIETAVFDCEGTLALRDGKLTFGTSARIGSQRTVTLAVTGGTGAYEGARGSIVSREQGKGDTTTDTVHLVG
jgi:hypothetical protein